VRDDGGDPTDAPSSFLPPASRARAPRRSTRNEAIIVSAGEDAHSAETTSSNQGGTSQLEKVVVHGPLSLTRSLSMSLVTQTGEPRRNRSFWGSCTERENATSQREEERGRKEERASPSTPPPPHLHRPHARPTRLELVDVELGGRVVRVPRARLGLARAGRRHLVKVVRRDRPGGARRARQARRRTDAPDEVGDEAAGERKREARQSQRRGPSGRGTGGTRRPTHPVQPVWCDAPRPLPFSQLKNSAREEGVRQ